MRAVKFLTCRTSQKLLRCEIWRFVNLDCQKHALLLRDKTMYDKLTNRCLNDDKQNYPFCRLKLLIEKLRHLLFGTNQSTHGTSITSFNL